MSDFEVVDEQADFIIVSKSADVNFHDEGQLGEGLFSQIKSRLNVDELYPVHRLDKMTSGLLIVAKTKGAANEFQNLFSTHQIQKYYLALSDNKPTKKQGLIKGDMAKSRRGMWKLLRTNNTPAITQFFSYAIKPGIRAFIVKPHSGKTHQIRVALASIKASIIGDPLYSKSTSDRGYLHAYAIQFSYQGKGFNYCLPPRTGQLFNDEEFNQWLASYKAPEQLKWPVV